MRGAVAFFFFGKKMGWEKNYEAFITTCELTVKNLRIILKKPTDNHIIIKKEQECRYYAKKIQR